MREKEMTVLEHIDELRVRIIKIVLGILVPIIVSMIYYEDIFRFLLNPVYGMNYLQGFMENFGLSMKETPENLVILQAIKPQDTFLAALKSSFTVGIFVSFPWIVYQIWGFISPALSGSEKKHTLPVVIFSSLFFLIGGSFAYFIALPFTLNFLANFGSDIVKNQWAIGEYFDFVVQIILAFGVVFELPLLAFVLAKLDLISAKFLRGHRKTALVVFLVLSAVLTPPDVTSQMMMAIPLLLLFEVSIIIVAIFKPKTIFDE
jgi:sec-independent protein translocase protein TatC